ncbi:MAG: hypothetical protein VB858_13235, partial [Planctomycetaceae bacterium]
MGICRDQAGFRQNVNAADGEVIAASPERTDFIVAGLSIVITGDRSLIINSVRARPDGRIGDHDWLHNKSAHSVYVPPIYLLAKQPNELTRWKTGKFHFRRFWLRRKTMLRRMSWLGGVIVLLGLTASARAQEPVGEQIS